MAVREIVHYGDPILRKVCKQVTDFSALPELVKDLFDTMYEAEGIGLAANQVGLDMNLFVVDTHESEDSDDRRIFVNGKIIRSWGESVFEEGCLSIPEVRLEVKRPEFIRFQYQDLEGNSHEEEFSGLLGRAIQHEMDHLTGIFIVDRVSEAQRLVIQKELRGIEKAAKSRIKSKKQEFIL